MKELQQHLSDKTELTVKKQQESRTELTGTIVPQLGHRVWQVNRETEEVSEAEYKEVAYQYAFAAKGDYSRKRELIMKEGFVYIPALNAANALKKFRKNSNQSAYYKPEPFLKLL